MKKIVLVILTCFLSMLTQASTLTVEVENGAWGEVKLLMYEEHFTDRKSLFALKKIDQEHKTSFDINMDQAIKVAVEVGRYSTDVYILPDQDYEILVYPYDQSFEILTDDTYKTNENLVNYEQEIRDYGADNVTIDFALTEDELANLEDFVFRVERKYRKTKGAFFNLYKRSSLRTFNLDIAKKTKNNVTIDTLFSNVILENKLHYDVPTYVSFLKRWHYTKYYGFQYKYGADEYDELVKIARDVDDPELQQFFELNAIEIAFKGHFYNIHLVGDDLDSILNYALNDELRIIAYNLKDMYYKFSEGDRLPNITLKDQYGTLVNLDDYNNQVIYIGFWTTWSSSAVRDLEVIQKIKKQFKDDVVFVSILIDANHNTLKRFLENKDYDWVFLNSGLSHSMKEDFQITTFPKYMIVGKGMEILEPNAEHPNDETLIELEMLIKGN